VPNFKNADPYRYIAHSNEIDTSLDVESLKTLKLEEERYRKVASADEKKMVDHLNANLLVVSKPVEEMMIEKGNLEMSTADKELA